MQAETHKKMTHCVRDAVLTSAIFLLYLVSYQVIISHLPGRFSLFSLSISDQKTTFWLAGGLTHHLFIQRDAFCGFSSFPIFVCWLVSLEFFNHRKNV